MKKIIIVLITILLVGCSNENYESLNVGYSTNYINDNDNKILKEIFTNHDISNPNIFLDFVNDYNQTEDKDCGLSNWVKSDTLKYNDSNCYNRFEEKYDKSDGNCRITSFILLNNSLSVKKEKNTSGSYLMFDSDVILNNNNYSFLKKDYNKFITLFDEIDVSKINKEDYINAYPNKWKDYQISLNTDKFSLISVVMNDPYDKVLFVGHAGILIPLKDKYLFIEKIAFEMPYQFNVIKNKEDLAKLFKNRSSYFDSESEGPYIYENDKLLYSF